MNKRRKIVILSAVVFTVTVMSALTPRFIEKLIIEKAHEKGWEVSFGKMEFGLTFVSMNDFKASNTTKSRIASFKNVKVELSAHLEPKRITATDGSILIDESRSPKSAGQKTKTNDVDILIVKSDVTFKRGDDGASLSDATIELTNGTINADGKKFHAFSKHGTADADSIRLEKGSTIKISCPKISVETHGMKMEAENFKIDELSMSDDKMNIKASADLMEFPRDISLSRVSTSIAFQKQDGITFDMRADSVTGKHDVVSKKVVETDRVYARGTFNTVEDGWKIKSTVGSKEAFAEVVFEKYGSGFVAAVDMGWTGCQSLLDAVPETMKKELVGAKFSGKIKGGFSVSQTKEEIPVVTFHMQNECKTEEMPDGVKSALSGRPFKREIRTGSGEAKEVTGSIGGAGWVGLNSISPYMVKAVVTTEDPGFWNHEGFDIGAIRNSIRDNVKERKFLRGASTIPMQLTKNMFLSREKTASRKLQEFFLTMIVVQKMTRDRILEAYLNMIEFGPNIYGIGSASEHYFRVDPSRLSLRQAVFLASILPKPRATYFGTDGKLGRGKSNHINLILDLMERKGTITSEECESAKNEELMFGGSEKVQNLDMSGWTTE